MPDRPQPCRSLSGAEYIHPFFLEHADKADKRQTHKGGRVFAFEFTEQRDTQALGFKAPGAIQRLFSGQIAAYLLRGQGADIDEVGDSIDLCSPCLSIQETQPRDKFDLAAADLSKLCFGRLKISRFAKDPTLTHGHLVGTDD